MKSATKQEQKIEAIERLKLLNVYKPIIKEFEKEDIINLSENGMLYWLDDDQKQMVESFETEYSAVVYHVICSYTQFGKLLSFLYVSKCKDEWDFDKDDIKNNQVCAYVKNLDDDWCSEFGSIGIKEQFGGLIRTC